MPATNAVSERSFSALKRVKTYLGSLTGDPRLNDLTMLHVLKDRTDALTLVDVANDFLGEKENRKLLFGKFSTNDIPNKFSIFIKVNTNGKLEIKQEVLYTTVVIWSTSTRKYALTEEPKWGGGLMWATRSAPP